MTQFDAYRDWKGWSGDAFAVCSASDARYFEAELSGLAGDLDGKSVLELGFGNGNFLAFCRQRGAEVCGLELDRQLVERARAEGFDAEVSSDTALERFAERKFDVIAAFDVFEHIGIEDLGTLLTRLGEMLTENGFILARFPSGDSPFSGAMYNGDLTHRTWIGSGIVQQLAIGSGLSVVRLQGARLPVTGLGIKAALRRGFVVAARTCIAAFLRPVYYSNAPRVIDPNAVVVLKRRDRDG